MAATVKQTQDVPPLPSRQDRTQNQQSQIQGNVTVPAYAQVPQQRPTYRSQESLDSMKRRLHTILLDKAKTLHDEVSHEVQESSKQEQQNESQFGDPAIRLAQETERGLLNVEELREETKKNCTMVIGKSKSICNRI
mmetsp:Transcript_104498/g.156489  ORF Transcript_104498/g.156489 Transcript_104498/m.156489 type:complete len:137 (-) Transcript_104498:179-589(-)